MLHAVAYAMILLRPYCRHALILRYILITAYAEESATALRYDTELRHIIAMAAIIRHTSYWHIRIELQYITTTMPLLLMGHRAL